MIDNLLNSYRKDDDYGTHDAVEILDLSKKEKLAAFDKKEVEVFDVVVNESEMNAIVRNPLHYEFQYNAYKSNFII